MLFTVRKHFTEDLNLQDELSILCCHTGASAHMHLSGNSGFSAALKKSSEFGRNNPILVHIQL